MAEHMNRWQSDSTAVRWPAGRDRLTDLPYPVWGITGAIVAFAIGGIVGTGIPDGSDPAAERLRSDLTALTGEIQELRSELEFREVEMQRLQAIQRYSTDYKVPADLATLIHDIALAEGLDPDLGFRLVKVESGFRRNVVSTMGAIGYTQVLPSTARWVDPTVDTSDLFEAQTNLHLGFRYLRYLLDEYEGDMRLALLAYNRGPNRVQGLLSMGIDPGNGYARAVLGE